jgi:hypothetical protein
VETTPYEDPVNNEANYVVDGLRVESEPVNGNLSGEVMRFEGRSGDCAGLYCVKALLSDGYSGGVAIVTGSRSPSLAERTVEAFTGSVQRRLD